MKLNPNIQTPLYKQVAMAIEEALNSGAYKPGDQIPSEENLCEAFGVSRVTLRSAVQLLCETGKLKKMHGKGTFVSAPVIVETKSGGSFTRFCKQINATPRTEVTSCETVAAQEHVAKNLGVKLPANAFRICRARYINDMAVIYEVDYFRSTDTYILTADVTKSPIADIIQKHTGLAAARFMDSFDVAGATEETTRVFHCQPGTPLLLVRQTVLTMDREIMYYNEQFILSERYKYVVYYT